MEFKELFRPEALIIDADTANEIDDLYAITRCLLDPSIKVIGLNSTQWNHRISPPDTVVQSQKLNEDLLKLTDSLHIPAPMGAEMIMGKPWGGIEPRDSPAARFIIDCASKIPSGEKLTIAALGALTNVASAIALAPDIVPKVALYFLGARYDYKNHIWNKDEFNIRNDLNAANYIFNTENLEVHLMPMQTCDHFIFNRETTFDKLEKAGPLGEYLAARWKQHAPDSDTWTMWDVALIEALLKPEAARQMKVMTPPENLQREIMVYTEIDIPALQKDWWDVFNKVPDAR